MQTTVACAKFGNLVVRCAPPQGFEIIRLVSGNCGVIVARVEVEETGIPRLKVSRLEPQDCLLEADATVLDRVLLASRRGEIASCFQLTATGTDDHIEIMLSGDHRHAGGHHRYRLFWWRAEFRLVNGEVVVHGPFLADDPDS
jgi:hypothetical protein